MISFLRRLFGKRLVHGDGARRGVAGDSVTMDELAWLLRRRALIIACPGKHPNDYASGAEGELTVIANALDDGLTLAEYVRASEERLRERSTSTQRPTTIEDIESSCGGPMLPDDRPAA